MPRSSEKGLIGPLEIISLSIGAALSLLIGIAAAFVIFYLCRGISPSVYVWLSLFVGLIIFSGMWVFFYLPRFKKSPRFGRTNTRKNLTTPREEEK
jgi:hypothetical protein